MKQLKRKLIKWLLKLLGHNTNKDVTITISADVSQALKELEELQSRLDQILQSQQQIQVNNIITIKGDDLMHTIKKLGSE